MLQSLPASASQVPAMTPTRSQCVQAGSGMSVDRIVHEMAFRPSLLVSETVFLVRLVLLAGTSPAVLVLSGPTSE